MKTKKNHKKNHSTRNHFKKNVSEKTMMKIMEREVAQIAKTTDFSKVSVDASCSSFYLGQFVFLEKYESHFP